MCNNDKINANFTKNLDIGFFKRAHFKNSCDEVINIALSVPGIHVLAVGPEACLRVLYFRALRGALLNRLKMLTISRVDSAIGVQTRLVESALQQIVAEEKDSVKAIIVYISCSDLLMASDFDSVLKYLELKFGIPIKLFRRGPLSKRRILPKDRLDQIFCEILKFYSEQPPEKQKMITSSVNILGEALTSTNCELKKLLVKENVHHFNELMGCKTFEQFSNLKKGKISIIIHKFGLKIAMYLEKTYNIPYYFVPTKYSLADIEINYKKLSEAFKIELDYEKDKKNFLMELGSLPQTLFAKKIAIGLGDRTVELAKALLEWKFTVKIILLEDTASKEDIKRIDEIKKRFKETQVIFVSSISMTDQQEIFKSVELSIGELASHYCVNANKIHFKERYDFGFQNSLRLISELHEGIM